MDQTTDVANKNILPDPASIVDVEKLSELWETGIISNQNGRSFISSLLASPTFELTEALHEHVKKHILSLKKPKVSTIGQIYFKVWKVAPPERREIIEEVCIQDLIRCSLVTKHQVAAYCLEALRPFVTQRKLKSVDPMLYKMSEPLIWRSLKAGNKEIRYNAIAFLLMTFPLRTYEQDPLAQLELLQRQLDTLNDYLFDEVSDIRQTTILGVGEIINLYWGLVPPSDLRKLLGNVTKLAWDKDSPHVRASVYKSMITVMENPESHVDLERLLPKLAKGIHDQNELIRSAFVDLLLETRTLKTLMFWKIVPIDDLMNQLAVEKSRSISERIVQLVFQSYFPNKESESVRLERTLTLFNQSMVAARKFYQYFAKFTTLESSVEQIMLLLRCVYGHLREAQSSDGSESSSVSNRTPLGDSSNQLDVTGGSDQCSGMNTTVAAVDTGSKVIDGPVVIALLDCAAILWNSIGHELVKDENKALWEQLYKKGGALILKFLKLFDDSLVLDSVLVLVGLMPKVASRYLSGSLTRKLIAIPDGGFDPKEHGTLTEALCHVQLNEIVNVVVKWWRNFDSPGPVGTTESPPPKAKRVRISVPEPEELAKPRLGIQIVSYLLKRHATRKYIVNGHADRLDDLELELRRMWDHCLSMEDDCCFDASWISEILMLRSTIVALCSAKDGGAADAKRFLSSFIGTLRLHVLPVYERYRVQDGEEDEKLDCAKTILKASCTIWADFIMCGLCDEESIITATDLSKTFLANGTDESLMGETGKLIFHILDYIRQNGVQEQVANVLRPWFDQVIELASSSDTDWFDGMTELKKLTDQFAKLLK